MTRKKYLMHSEHRWALIRAVYVGPHEFVSRCYLGVGEKHEPRIRTFRTREQARQARRKALCVHISNARVVKVLMTIREVEL